MRQYTLWVCYPEEPTKPWLFVSSIYTDSEQEAVDYWIENGELGYTGGEDSEFIITFQY